MMTPQTLSTIPQAAIFGPQHSSEAMARPKHEATDRPTDRPAADSAAAGCPWQVTRGALPLVRRSGGRRRFPGLPCAGKRWTRLRGGAGPQRRRVGGCARSAPFRQARGRPRELTGRGRLWSLDRAEAADPPAGVTWSSPQKPPVPNLPTLPLASRGAREQKSASPPRRERRKGRRPPATATQTRFTCSREKLY